MYISVLAGPILALAACAPFLPIGSPFSPQSASATGQAETVARDSVPIAQTLEGIAQIGELVPGATIPAAVFDRFCSGYFSEMLRQIDGLETRQQRWEESHQGAPVRQDDWWWAIGLALLAGGSNVFSYRTGQRRVA